MPAEHAIRLRGAWDGPDVARAPGRLTLPAAWPPGPAAPFRLARRFGRPPIDPDREALTLCLEAVPGLTRVVLNGQNLAEPPVGTTELRLPIPGPLPGRNLLVLEVDPAAWTGLPPGGPWGEVSLRIGPR